jgi:4'-phosphopantetheinyl transferase
MMIRHWIDLPERSLPPTGECQLWLAWLDEEDPDAWLGYLSEDERLRASRLRSPRSADRFIVGRGILRFILGRYLATRPEALVFEYGPQGKPRLAACWGERLSFNVSHSAGLEVFAIANGFEIGVDIEQVHPVSNLEATASFFLSPEELKELDALPTRRKLERFFELWACKESILKARGYGFASPAKDVLAEFGRLGPEGEWLALLNPAEGFKGALTCLQPHTKE